MTSWRSAVSSALQALGTERLALAIHDASFPADSDEDVGRGTPYGRGAARFVEAMASLGFDALQLGPQGETSAFDPSPYDGTVMARNRASIAYGALADDPTWGRLVDAEQLAERAAAAGGARAVADHAASHEAQDALLEAAHRRLLAARARGEAAQMDHLVGAFAADYRGWLAPMALYEPLCRQHGHGDFRRWPAALDRRLWSPEPREAEHAEARRRELRAREAETVDRFTLGQLLVHAQHDAFRRRCRALGVALQADLQIGLGPADTWIHRSAFLPGYLMGAPPSRTNPEGQPWGYPVLAPFTAAGGATAQRFVEARLTKIFREFDAVRIDHPHGWVCPWVYRADAEDPLHAVQHGARLYGSPFLPDHPELSEHAIARPEQIDRSLPRHADGWIRGLEPEQIERYARSFDAIVAAAARVGQHPSELICEVLSTLPRPLAEVMARHGLGRFRVTQKAKLDDPNDVYRSENAEARDWIMVGTHDTPSIWAVADGWAASGELEAQARYLSDRLGRPVEARPGSVAQAKLAELFVAEARRVMIFFADLFGQRERYNLPGTVGPHNWSLRVPPGWRRDYAPAAERGEALHLPRALAWALAARGVAPELVAALETLPPTPGGAPWQD